LYVRSRGTDEIWISLTKFPFSRVVSRGPILISEKDPTKPKFLGKDSLSRTISCAGRHVLAHDLAAVAGLVLARRTLLSSS